MTEARKLTRNQSLVLEKLKSAAGPLSAYDLLDRLRSNGFRAPLQVYRALKVLMERGKVHRLESLSAFVACCGNHGHDAVMVAFAICDECGQVSEFADETVSDRLQQWVGRRGFTAATAAIEIRGLCEACSPQTN